MIEQIISALQLDEEPAARLRAEVRAAYAATNGRRIDAGFSLKPDVVRGLERSASSLAAFQSAVVPRLLRTGDYAKAAGLEGVRFHDLRHAGNTFAAEAGASLRELMNRMGHSSPRAAMIYLHARDDRARELADRLGERAAEELRRARDSGGGDEDEPPLVGVRR